jgi:hypothetical protein
MGCLNIMLILSMFGSLISACQSTSGFRSETFHDRAGDFHIIYTNSDRVQEKCLLLHAEEENNWRHQYILYVLSDKNELL